MTKRFDYETVYEYLKNHIKDDLRDNEKIPSENELCERFNVTRATVRQGISKLKNEGLLFSKKGSGYFVSPEKVKYSLSKNTTFTKEIQASGKTPSLCVVKVQEIKANKFLASKFGIQENAPLTNAIILRLVDDEPFLIGCNYFNAEILKDIEKHINNDLFSLTKLFVEEYSIKPFRNHSELEIVPNNQEYKKLLSIQNDLPLIKISSVSVCDKSNQVIEYVESFFRSDRVKLNIEFSNQ
ncbi:GntR family transcriptional regulator [Arcobacter sp. FWKO B]|uniref:GntR family transcriptional regulator n=1 Tax=Arcobacter sp. FWKO B TaxID=2593672 RepID=UPI0018A68832|nr:GntR family transcriptional regulator [Arcobacter sp. FWKO B]QOG12339.1 GntR family transcriptional regulator [Arcobacter sp. FWKO B]